MTSPVRLPRLPGRLLAGFCLGLPTLANQLHESHCDGVQKHVFFRYEQRVAPCRREVMPCSHLGWLTQGLTSTVTSTPRPVGYLAFV
jgi:hypothetical protein